MTFDISRISDPLYFAENVVPAHSSHRWFKNAQEAATGTSSFEQSLNGVWKFHFARNFDAVVPGFESIDHDSSTWDDIPVPAHIQLHSYDRPQYSNVQYPWDGHEDVKPGQIPTWYNPVASYVTHFDHDQELADGERLSITFHGAESAIALWLNGTYIGYSCDSFTPSEFDLTHALVPGENKLAAQVFKWSSASWLEDQDFFRFSGIFRDVTLNRKAAVHADDILVKTVLTDDFASATVNLSAKLSGQGSVRATLVNVGELSESTDGALSITVDQPNLWSSENPYLYDLEIEVVDKNGVVTEFINQKVGIRRFLIEDGLLKINGQRIVFNGVNRHDFGLQGRVISREQTEADILLLKSLGLNAVRTSHYPANSYFYDLCDQYGLYVIDEMNLETHGVWDPIMTGDAPIENAIPGDNPAWLPAVIDRANNVLERDKNHASVIMWSSGNESYGGINFQKVADHFHSKDDRPVQYEGIFWDPRYPDSSDVYSQMYTPADQVEEFLKTNRDKPMILCEFAHAMGNSFGAVDKYVDLSYREPLYQGGFIWDFADQAIAMTDRFGNDFFGYGGDNQEAPHDKEFCGNGLLFADHTPKPFTQEVKYLYRGITSQITESEVTVGSRLLFTNTNAYEAVVTLKQEGKVLKEAILETDVAPLAAATYPLPVAVPSVPGEYTVTVSYRERNATPWAPAGHEVAWDQAVFTVADPSPKPQRAPKPRLVNGIHNVGVHGKSFSVSFSRKNGGLESYRFGQTQNGGREMLRSMPMPNFWHAQTDNERGWKAGMLDSQWLLASRYAQAKDGFKEPIITEHEDSISVMFTYVLPTVPVSESTVTYRVFGDGLVQTTVTVTPGEGLADMPEFGMLMTGDADLVNLRFYGEGPAESYVDRRGGARLDVFEADVRTELTKHLRPQESGSHTGVRWATVTDQRGYGLRFEHEQSMEFSALPWTPFEIENALHHTELPPSHRTVFRPALMRRGAGGDDTWGSQTHPEYRLPAGKDLSFTFSFQGVMLGR